MVVSVRRPRAIVFDILGTASKSGFLERILFPFLKINLDSYVNSHWQKRDFIRLYNKILEQSSEFHHQEPRTPMVLPHSHTEARASLLNFINFVTDEGINSSAVTQLRFMVWFEGYQQNKIKTPIYSDVPNKIRQWFSEGTKFYVFSNTWIDAQKALLRNTDHGDLTNLISGHYDNDFGMITESESWKRLCNDIREQAQDVLFLTKSAVEGRAAAEAGVSVVLVLTHRHNVKAIPHEDRQRFPYVRTLNELVWNDTVLASGVNMGGSQQVGPSGGVEGSNQMAPSADNAGFSGNATELAAGTVQGPLATAMSAPSSLPPASTLPASAAVPSAATGAPAAPDVSNATIMPASGANSSSSKPSAGSGHKKGGHSRAGGSKHKK